jgi:hypothetical protein
MLLDLLPVPAAIVEMRGGKFHFEALNRPFRMAGLGTSPADSPVIRLLGTAHPPLPRIERSRRARSPGSSATKSIAAISA